jgi:hypothetical protein
VCAAMVGVKVKSCGLRVEGVGFIIRVMVRFFFFRVKKIRELRCGRLKCRVWGLGFRV